MLRASILATAALLSAFACAPTRAPAALADGPLLADGPQLGGADLAHWAQVLEPAADDRAWLSIPWLPSLHDGLEAAAEAERPLLLWLMNGHPLGCT